MEKMKIVNKADNCVPESYVPPTYATPGSAGFDLRANIKDSITLKSFERKLIKTGLFMEIPKGHVGYVCTRSGLALKKGLQVLNAPGVVDEDFRNEVGVILINLSTEDVVIEPGERIAQMVISEYQKVEFDVINNLEELTATDRTGGFGSTGTK